MKISSKINKQTGKYFLKNGKANLIYKQLEFRRKIAASKFSSCMFDYRKPHRKKKIVYSDQKFSSLFFENYLELFLLQID